MNQSNRLGGNILGSVASQQLMGANYDPRPAQRAEAIRMALAAAGGVLASTDDLIASAKKIDAYLHGEGDSGL